MVGEALRHSQELPCSSEEKSCGLDMTAFLEAGMVQGARTELPAGACLGWWDVAGQCKTRADIWATPLGQLGSRTGIR